jgi:hypothetical protein
MAVIAPIALKKFVHSDNRDHSDRLRPVRQISPRTEVYQMRENMSLLSFWGLVFSLIAVTLFVVIYSYQQSKYTNRRIVEDLRQRSVDVYLAAKTPEAESDSKRFREASNEIERLRTEARVLFWLIIAMNTAVIIIFIVAYRYF